MSVSFTKIGWYDRRQLSLDEEFHTHGLLAKQQQQHPVLLGRDHGLTLTVPKGEIKREGERGMEI